MRSIHAAAIVIMVCGFLAAFDTMSDAAEPTSQPATMPMDNPDVIQWRLHCDLEDGRRLISDGGLMLESKYLPKVPVPEKSVPAAGAERLLKSETDQEFGLNDLKQKEANGHFASPSGIQLNRKYVKCLRESPLRATVRFRGKGLNDPILILDDEKVVGVMMPIKS